MVLTYSRWGDNPHSSNKKYIIITKNLKILKITLQNRKK
ncbi:hypothetical protein NT98_2076 [Bacillus cereus]|nr:hypothetical protein NT98_2076 [Bacillus cereus]AJG92436.1 hypothetical protein BG03_1641 [Bacillus cereus]AJI04502.1 hypothetical protein AQ16_4482 [Bacillus cereus G9241]